MRTLRERVRRYFGALRWFAGDVAGRYRWRLGAVAAGNLAGLALQAAAVFMSYHYARALEENRTLELLGYALPARSSFQLLAWVAAAFLGLVICAALLIVKARVAGISIARDYGDFCSQRIFVLASRLPAARAPEASAGLGRVNELAGRDANDCGFTLRILLQGVLPLSTALASGVALAALDAGLSLILFAVLAAATFFLYRISLQGASHWTVMKARLPGAAAERQALGRRVALSPAPLDPADQGMSAIFRHGAAGKAGDAMVGQRQVLERAILVAQVAMGCALFLILLVQGGATLRSESNWSALLAYLAVFSVFGSRVSMVMRLLISVNRFYPAIGRHARFVSDAQAAAVHGGAAPAVEGYRLQAAALDGSAPSLEARRGERIALVTPSALDRRGLAPLALALSPLVLPWFASGRFVPLGASLRENFGLPADYGREQLEADLRSLGLEAPAQRPGKALAPALAFALAALAGIRGARGLLALEQRALAELEAGGAAALLEKARGCVVLIGYTPQSLQALGSYGESALVICDAGRVVGWAPLAQFRAGEARVLQAIAGLRAREGARTSSDADEDALDEVS